jgi:hypothetical protein
VSRKVDALTVTEPVCSRANGASFPSRSNRKRSVSPTRGAEGSDSGTNSSG